MITVPLTILSDWRLLQAWSRKQEVEWICGGSQLTASFAELKAALGDFWGDCDDTLRTDTLNALYGGVALVRACLPFNPSSDAGCFRRHILHGWDSKTNS